MGTQGHIQVVGGGGYQVLTPVKYVLAQKSVLKLQVKKTSYLRPLDKVFERENSLGTPNKILLAITFHYVYNI